MDCSNQAHILALVETCENLRFSQSFELTGIFKAYNTQEIRDEDALTILKTKDPDTRFFLCCDFVANCAVDVDYMNYLIIVLNSEKFDVDEKIKNIDRGLRKILVRYSINNSLEQFHPTEMEKRVLKAIRSFNIGIALY